MRAVIFDLDDTLYSEITYVRSGFAAVAEVLSARVPKAPEPIRQRLHEILEAHGRGQIFDRILAELGLSSAAMTWTLVAAYRSHRPTISLDPQAVPLFRELRGLGYQIALITDGMAVVQRQKIAALDLDRHLDFALCTDVLGPTNWKPSVVPYQVVLQRLGVSAEDSVYVGDNDVKDFVGPRALGMGTVRSTQFRPYNPQTPSSHRADRAIASLDALPGLLQEMP